MDLFLRYKFFFCLLFLSLLSVISLFHFGLIPTHDGEYHVIRFYEFDKVLRDGILYPRWAPDLNNGYGVPLFNYVYPLPNYIAYFTHVFGFNFIDSFKIGLMISSLLGSLFSYLWLKRFFGKYCALIGSIFFTYSPYRFVDIYVRGSIGEIWAMSLFLGALWGITEYLYTKNKKYFFISSLLLSCTIFAHNILGLMYFVFFLSYLLFIFIYKTEHREKKIFLIPLFSVCITSIFWMPALLETEFARGLQVFDINNNFPELYQLIFPSWGTGFSATTLNNQMSFQIGVANILVVLISIFLLKKKNEYRKFLYFFLCCFVVVGFLILPYSAWVWQKVPLLTYFQFPWRFLSLIIIFSAFIASYVSKFIRWRLIKLILLVIPIIFAIQYTIPAYYLERPDSYYTTRANFIDGTNSPGNIFNTIWMNGSLQKNKNSLILSENPNYVVKVRKTSEYMVTTHSQIQQLIVVNIAYFPGWKAFVDEKEVKTTYNRDGLLVFGLEKGDHLVRIVFKDTKVRTIAQLISIFSFFGLIIFSLKCRYKI